MSLREVDERNDTELSVEITIPRWAIIVMFLMVGLPVAVVLGGCQLFDPGYQGQPYQGGYQQAGYQQAGYQQGYYSQPAPEYAPAPQSATLPQAATQPTGTGASTPPNLAASILGQSGGPANPQMSQPQANSAHRPDIPAVGVAVPSAGLWAQSAGTPPFVPPQPSSGIVSTGLSILELLGLAIPGVAGVAYAGRRWYQAAQQAKTLCAIAPAVHRATYHGQAFDPQAVRQLPVKQQQIIRSVVPPSTV